MDNRVGIFVAEEWGLCIDKATVVLSSKGFVGNLRVSRATGYRIHCFVLFYQQSLCLRSIVNEPYTLNLKGL